ncbi:LysR family transcriptional regulator [Peredibacter sp. HCB2-198]|uniref:LysR family transcriptional regulator n=1 Tax=Peredibacter sp. HCB2-198 TaxID=3383025 RepID=UPI0038B5DC93
MIETSMLQVLIALSQNENISKAAEELNVTQSAVSQALKNLESKVGFSVVTRQGKSVNLTESGMRLAKVAKQYFKRIEETIEQIHLENHEIKGRLHVGSLYGLGKTWLSSRMLGFLSQYPELEVRLSMDFPETIIKKFEQHEIDCLIMPEHLVPAFAEKLDLHTEHTTLVFSEKFNITNKTELKDILNIPIIFYENNDPNFYRWCREKFGVVPRNVKPRLVVNSFGQMLQAVNGGLGVAVVPTHVLQRSNMKSNLKTVGKEFEIFSNKVSFAFHADEAQSYKIKELYKYLHEAAKDL